MPLQAGTRIGGYEVSALIGAGGMGEVYRARDLRLGRDVAIKILSPKITADADALMRFDREARALASLNHPNIGGILGVEDYAHQPALILELIDGETLADRIGRGSIPVNEAIDYAKQLCDALDVAHEAGIVHRDLKPGNIKITEDGRIKILDFGLAKAIAAASGESSDINPANSPTITVHGTQHGVILGTAAYMSPEQARGKRIDKRTDIWAFGCVLFEMLTGKRAFNGETTSDVIAAIIERTPDQNLLPRSTPPHVRRVLERCLEKDPKRRARDIADVRAELDASAAVSPAPRRTLLTPALALVALIAVIAALLLWRSRPAPASPPAPIAFSFGAPPGYALLPVLAAPSPDGHSIAFLARDEKLVSSIFVRAVDTAVSRRLPGTEGAGTPPIWSPDGRSMVFFAGGVWKRIDSNGGPAVTFSSSLQANLGATWGPGDVLLLSPGNRTSLFKLPISASLQTPQPVTALNAEQENSHRFPQLLPDGRHFLFTVRSDSPDRLGIKLGSLDSTEIRSLVKVASQGRYADPGFLLFVTPDQALMAQPLEPSTWTLHGSARAIAGPVRYNGGSFNGAFDVSNDGRVITYVPATQASSTLEWFDRTGKHLGRIGPEREYGDVRVSADARSVAVELADPQLGTRDVWLLDVMANTLSRFTPNPATDWRAIISPDGKSVAFASDRAGLSAVYRASISNPGDDTLVLRLPSLGVFPTNWSADGRHLYVSGDDAQGQPRQLMRVSVAGGDPEKLMTDDQRLLVMPRVSPQEDLVAYASRDAGGTQVFVSSLHDGSRVRVTTDGGSNPVWAPDGKSLYYLNGQGELMNAALSGTKLSGLPHVLFKPCQAVGRTVMGDATRWNFDVTSDGQRFLFVCGSPESTTPAAINVVVNWQSKLQ